MGSSSSYRDSRVSQRKKRSEMESDMCLFTGGGRDDQKQLKGEIKKRKAYDLVSYMELPDYMKDNEYILDYYRANWPLKQALLSIFRWHNETLNIWTHLVGFLVFLGLTMFHLEWMPNVSDLLSNFTRSFPIYAGAQDTENSSSTFLSRTALTDLEISTISQPATARWPFFIFLGGSMFCLLSSSLCHLLGCQSHRCNLHLLRLDYVGIAVMIVASFFPPIYYIFQCEPHWQFVYLAGITTMGVATIVTLLSPLHSTTAAFRAFRAGIFASMGLSGIIPAVHATIANWNEPLRNVTLAYEAGMAAAYLVGTVFYVCRIPEKWKPGRFDLAGQSHQIFHVLVVLGALAHYGAVVLFLDWRDRVGCNRVG